MKELTSTISSKGQTTIPVEIRRRLKIAPRSKVAFVIDRAGSIKIKRASYQSIDSLKGVAGSLKKAYKWSDIKKIAYEDRKKLS